MTKKSPLPKLERLSRRERQVMDILFELGTATAEQVRSRLPEPPTYSTARAMLSKLERKGFVEHREQNLRYVYEPTISASHARRTAIDRLAKVFYEGSVGLAAAGLLEQSVDEIPEDELERLAGLIEQARAARDKGTKS